MPDYSIYSDEHLVLELRESEGPQNDAIMDYLLEKYKPLVRKATNALYIIGAETDDLIQEGMIGLFKAIRDYDETKETSFFTFAQLCIRRQVYKALESGNRMKNFALNHSLSINAGEDESNLELENFLKQEADNPEQLVLEREFWDEFQKKITEKLSVMERQVLTLYLEGKPYTEIAVFLNRPPKAIDNALQRIRKKVAAMTEESR